MSKRLPPARARPSPWPDVECDRARPSAATTRRRTRRLRDVIVEGITTTTPHARSSGGAGVFAGSFDWHSAAHAHWALLSIARVTGDSALEALLERRLSNDALEAERRFLERDPGFELPYGRAWLLLLLHEMTRRGRRPRAVAALRQDTETAVMDWLDRSPYPEGGTAAAPVFNAAHDSWLFAYLLALLSASSSTSVTERLRELRRSKLEPARAKLAAARHTPADFLYLPAVQALADRVDPAGTAPGPYPVGSSPPLADPPLTTASAHSAGAAVVRIWPHALHEAAGDTRACARFHARMSEMFSRTDHWADSFELAESPPHAIRMAGAEAYEGVRCLRNGWLPQRSRCTTSPTGRRVVGP